MVTCYEAPYSSLRGVSEVPNAISHRFQSLPQRLLSRLLSYHRFGGAHTLLLLRQITHLQPMERVKEVCGLKLCP